MFCCCKKNGSAKPNEKDGWSTKKHVLYMLSEIGLVIVYVLVYFLWARPRLAVGTTYAKMVTGAYAVFALCVIHNMLMVIYDFVNHFRKPKKKEDEDETD